MSLQKIDAQDVGKVRGRNFPRAEFVDDMRRNVDVIRKIFLVNENDLVMSRVLLERIVTAPVE